MAGLIWCKGKYSQRPYYISNMAVNIYSMEELCYYIYNNIYLIGTDLFDSGLIDYIDRELGEKELAEELEFLTSQNAGLSEMVMTVLRHVDYYSEDEISELQKVIDRLDTQNAFERLKLRADNFLSNRRYSSAIHNYETILYGRRDDTLDDMFYGNVWHNMGVAYTRMMAYEEATLCFTKAYELNRLENTHNALIAARKLAGKNNDDSDEEQVYMVVREIETIMDHAVDDQAYAPVKKAFELKDEGKTIEYSSQLDSIVDGWKADYRNYIK